MVIMMMRLMMIMRTKPYDYDDDTEDDNDHKTDGYTAAGAALGASFEMCKDVKLWVLAIC